MCIRDRAELVRDKEVPPIARATAILQRSLLNAPVPLDVEFEALEDDDPQVRQAAVGRFEPFIPSVGAGLLNEQQVRMVRQQIEPAVRALVPLLRDPRRNGRAVVGRVLARVPSQLVSEMLNGDQRDALDHAIDEYLVGLDESNDRGGAHMARAVLYESMGKLAEAEEAYRTAIHVEPQLTGPRANLAALLEQVLQRDAAGYRRLSPQDVARQQEEIGSLRREELENLARDARLLPDSAPIQYRYGLSLYLHDRREEAETALKRAVELAPDNDSFLFALALFYEKYRQYDLALGCADKLVALQPDAEQYRAFRKKLRDEAAEAAGSAPQAAGQDSR
jgi:tetratricopeptide (TPR) repeat protein